MLPLHEKLLGLSKDDQSNPPTSKMLLPIQM